MAGFDQEARTHVRGTEEGDKRRSGAKFLPSWGQKGARNLVQSGRDTGYLANLSVPTCGSVFRTRRLESGKGS